MALSYIGQLKEGPKVDYPIYELEMELLRNTLRQQGAKTNQNSMKCFIRRKFEEEKIVWNKGLYLYFFEIHDFWGRNLIALVLLIG